jgi:hypothetical protein
VNTQGFRRRDLVEIINYRRGGYGNGKMETRERTNYLETVQGARGDGTTP